MLKILTSALSIISFLTVANAVTQEDIDQLSTTEVASLTCTSIKNLKFAPLQYLVPEKDYKKMVKHYEKTPEKFKKLISDINCTVTNTKLITKKYNNKISYTQVTFKKFNQINVYKVDEKYQIVMKG